MMQHEYRALSEQREFLKNTRNASDVNVSNLQKFSENMQTAVTLFLDTIEHVQKRVNSNLERCRREAKNKHARVEFLDSEQEKMEKEIPKLKSDISVIII
ncbi:hypothetical protein DPMN_066224 [Dreissena polymorpha]|uniref:Uncharacterized protein n=1 Tax=Dreissena polymorpha TaxID=45954 RepID=A0A9D4BSN8_DREPO|nr:hypothetical protein DPMN_066224 [Dreissena polymorpha]